MTATVAGSLDADLTNFLVDSRARGHREDTLTLRRGVLRRLSIHVSGKPLVTLSADEVYGFFIQFRNLTPATRNSYGAALKAFYRYAVRRGLTEVDPTAALPIPRVPPKKPRPISAEHIHLALQHADPRMRLWIMLGAGAGLRAGEIARLNREDIDTDASPPAINVVNGKGGRDRTVTIGEHLATELTAWRVRFGRMWRVSPHTVTVTMARYFERLGVPATCHALRHTYASTLYAESGSDIRLVQTMLGHASLNSTQIYTAFEPRKAIDAIDVVDQLLADAAALPLEARHRVAEALRKLQEEDRLE